MEQNEKPAQGLSASAKRRRRRRRAAASAAAAATAQNGQAPQGGQNSQPRAEAGQKQNNGQKPGAPRQNSQKQGSQNRGERAAAPARGPKQAFAARPAREAGDRNARRGEKPAKAPARTADEDPGLLLISRKPPAQKFASFEEYMKSRGGPGAPIEGEEE